MFSLSHNVLYHLKLKRMWCIIFALRLNIKTIARVQYISIVITRIINALKIFIKIYYICCRCLKFHVMISSKVAEKIREVQIHEFETKRIVANLLQRFGIVLIQLIVFIKCKPKWNQLSFIKINALSLQFDISQNVQIYNCYIICCCCLGQ